MGAAEAAEQATLTEAANGHYIKQKSRRQALAEGGIDKQIRRAGNERE